MHVHRGLKYPLGTLFEKTFDHYGTFKGEVVSYDGQHYKVFYPEDNDCEELSEDEFEESNIKILTTSDKPKKSGAALDEDGDCLNVDDLKVPAKPQKRGMTALLEDSEWSDEDCGDETMKFPAARRKRLSKWKPKGSAYDKFNDDPEGETTDDEFQVSSNNSSTLTKKSLQSKPNKKKRKINYTIPAEKAGAAVVNSREAAQIDAVNGSIVAIWDGESSRLRRLVRLEDGKDRILANTSFAMAKHKENEENLIASKPCDYKGNCEVCSETFLGKSPRNLVATECQHLLCRDCSETVNIENICPVCDFSLVHGHLQLKTYEENREDVAFKAVEQIDMETGQVSAVYCSASSASVAVALNAERGQALSKSASHIIRACQSKRMKDREYAGHYWKFLGSRDRILKLGEGIKDGISIEQIDPSTMKVIRIFPSSRKATEKTGVARCSISRVLAKKGKPLAGGFFWRFEGENHGPWEEASRVDQNPVEKLCLKTGDVLEEFISLGAAKKAMGMALNSGCIRDVCNAMRKSAKGFFWRWKGSEALPERLKTYRITVQLRKLLKGPVVKEYPTSYAAAEDFDVCNSSICRWCRENRHERGFYWQYKFNRVKASEEETVVGKRLRVYSSDGSWLEGHIGGFDFNTKKHIIIYDKGDKAEVDLKQIRYEWKSDQGQKPVEQLDLETGQVIASFDSISAAIKAVVGAESTDNFGGGHGLITAVLNGYSKSAMGFFWRYKGSDKLPPKKKGRRPVQQLNLETGTVIATYKTITEAGKAVGITTPGISYCCNGRNHSRSAGGFGWRFAPEGS